MNDTEPRRRTFSLRQRLLIGLLGYTLLLSVAVSIHGVVVNEHAEQVVWDTLLASELDHLEERIATDPEYRWQDTRSMSLYDTRSSGAIPPALLALPPGVHDEVPLDGRERVVLVRQEGAHREYLALDISDIEARERSMTLTVVGSALTLLLVLGLLTAWAATRLVQPLTNLARQIGQLRPDRAGQRLQLQRSATTELDVIGRALNDYLARNDQFVERERLFIDMASHELRTPIAVVVGAADLGARSADTPPAVRVLLDRIKGAAQGMQELVTLLLVLARDPARLRQVEETIRLDELVPSLIEDHRHLTRYKHLELQWQAAPGIEVIGPPQIVGTAIGNLLRNAIENSERGVIRISAQAPGRVIVEDPGHGLDAEEIGKLYAQIARGEGERAGGGIGLDLLARLCEHLGWGLEFKPAQGRGTRAILTLNAK